MASLRPSSPHRPLLLVPQSSILLGHWPGRQDARARRVGGGQGDSGGYRAPAGGRFAGRAPSRFQYGYGPRDRGFGGGFEAPRFPRGGDRRPRGRRDRGYALPDFGYPSVEQMTRHWFASHFANPSVETFAPSMSRW